jgi:hypothetical protein
MEPREKKTYLVIFQIAERANREKLRGAMKLLASYCPLSNTAWAIVSDKPASELRDNFAKFVVNPDRLYVIEAGGTGAWRNAISKEHTDWLKANL